MRTIKDYLLLHLEHEISSKSSERYDYIALHIIDNLMLGIDIRKEIYHNDLIDRIIVHSDLVCFDQALIQVLQQGDVIFSSFKLGASDFVNCTDDINHHFVYWNMESDKLIIIIYQATDYDDADEF